MVKSLKFDNATVVATEHRFAQGVTHIKIVGEVNAAIADNLGIRYVAFDRDQFIKRGYKSIELDYESGALKMVLQVQGYQGEVQVEAQKACSFKVIKSGDGRKKPRRLLVAFKVIAAGLQHELEVWIAYKGGAKGTIELTPRGAESLFAEQEQEQEKEPEAKPAKRGKKGGPVQQELPTAEPEAAGVAQPAVAEPEVEESKGDAGLIAGMDTANGPDATVTAVGEKKTNGQIEWRTEDERRAGVPLDPEAADAGVRENGPALAPAAHMRRLEKLSAPKSKPRTRSEAPKPSARGKVKVIGKKKGKGRR